MSENKSSMSKIERRERSKAAKIVSGESFVLGSLIKMARVCGKETCKCAAGEKHVSLYLAIRKDRKRKMIYIPKDLEGKARTLVGEYQKMKRSLEMISDNCLNRLLHAKKRLSGKDA